MLDRTKLLKELSATASLLCDSYVRERAQAQVIWQKLCADTERIELIQDQEWPFLVPSWVGNLNKPVEVFCDRSDYTVFAVDGSQVYPDRHQGMACYLLNIGTAFFRYSNQVAVPSKARFRSEPVIKVGYEHSSNVNGPSDELAGSAQEVIADLVNCQRTELELKTAVDIVEKLKDPGLFLFDGSLIFWHLAGKDAQVKNRFLKSYLDLLERLYRNKSLHAGYISLPKSRELVNLVRAASQDTNWLAECGQQAAAHQMFGSLVDSDIVRFFVQPNHRTIVFKNSSPIVDQYPAYLRPHFFYLNNGTEIARIEIPAWIAAEPKHVDYIAQIILNQSAKGHGYPICLAEAHEQAVIKTADREFFYHILQKYAFDRGHVHQLSQKSIQKQGIGI